MLREPHTVDAKSKKVGRLASRAGNTYRVPKMKRIAAQPHYLGGARSKLRSLANRRHEPVRIHRTLRDSLPNGGLHMKKVYVKPVLRTPRVLPGGVEAGARFAQKRSVPRYPFSANATVVEPLSRIEVAGRTADISARGCYVESIDRFPLNTVIRLTIEQAGGERFETWGRVVHVRPGTGSGLALFETSPEQRLTLEKWISEAAESIQISNPL